MYALQPNGLDLAEDDQEEEYKKAEPHGHANDDARKENVSVTPQPSWPGISHVQITVRETIIILVALGGFLLQWAQMSAQMTMVGHDVASLHQDVSAFAVTLRTHIDSPGHAVELERQNVINSRLDDMNARLKSIEAAEAVRMGRNR